LQRVNIMNLTFGRRYVKLKNILIRLYNKFWDEEITSSSAQVAFYLSFSLFPLLLFLVNLFGLILGTATDLQDELFSYLRQIMPFSAYQLVQKTILEVSENSSSGKLTLGFLVALWSASAGMDSLRVSLNHVYKIKETRPYWVTKLESLGLTLVLIFLLSFVLGIVFYGWKFLSFLLTLVKLPIASFWILISIQWISFIIVLLLTFGLVYNFLPNIKDHKRNWISYGSVTAIILWVLLTNGFRIYLYYFNNYDKTYGSLGAVIILMLWLYLTSLVILIGGALNAVLSEINAEKTIQKEDSASKEIESTN